MNHLFKALGLACGVAALTTAAFAQDVRLRAAFGSPTGASGQLMTYISNVVGRVDPDISIELSADQPGTRSIIQAAQGEADLFNYIPFIANYLETGEAMYSDVPNHEELFGNVSAMFLYPGGVFQLVVWEESGIRSFEDLRGRNVFFGPRGAAVSRQMQALVEATTGMVAGEDYTLVSLDFSSSFQAFQDGQIDTFFRPVQIGFPVIQQAAAIGDIRIIGLTEELLEMPEVAAMSAAAGRTVVPIPPDAYGENQANEETVYFWQDWTGVGFGADVSDDVAYAITRAFWENISELNEVAAWSREISLDTFGDNRNLPIHPGALRYYSEIGVEPSEGP